MLIVLRRPGKGEQVMIDSDNIRIARQEGDDTHIAFKDGNALFVAETPWEIYRRISQAGFDLPDCSIVGPNETGPDGRKQ